MGSNEDTVECNYFSINSDTNQEYWVNLCEQLNGTIEELSQDYLWHKENFFIIRPIIENKSEEQPCLFSSTCFDGNIQDEWFIVYLITKLTEAYPELVVQINDNDGDFLLIEAANYLPAWLNPDTSQNRVFMHRGKFHIISEGDTNLDISLNAALDYLKKSPNKTVAPIEIQNAINKKVTGYPDKIKDGLHKVLVKVPLELATVLALEPNVIASFVTAYCNHDIIDIKQCRTREYNDLVNIQVKLTKHLYAMLLHSKVLICKNTMTGDKKSELGFKLHFGYNIVMNESENILKSKDYNKFLRNLTSINYFNDNIEGSKDYSILLEKANDYYMKSLCPLNKSISNHIKKLKETDNFKKQCEIMKNVDHSTLSDDSEDWLNVSPEELDTFLESRYCKKNSIKEITPQTVSKQISNFLHQTSDYEGIEVNNRENDKNQIEFEPDIFAETLEKFLNIVTSNGTENTDESEDDFDSSDEDIEVEKTDAKCKDTSTYQYLKQSLKEESGYCGPSSTLINNVGLHKNDILDSDDD